MVRIQRGRAWRLLFAVILSSAFAGYYVFWRHTFVPSSDAGKGAVAETCGTCQDLASALFGQDHEPFLNSGPDGRADDPGPRMREAASSRHGVDLSRAARTAAVRRSKRFGGPYSLAVREGLKGVLLPDLDESMVAGMPELGGGDGLDRPAPQQSYPGLAPTYGYITSGFGLRRSPFHGGIVQHRGVDFAVPYGADVFATGDGEVVFAGWFSGLGRTVAIDHGQGIVTRYAHASRLLVSEGDPVRGGDVIAKAGNSGRSTGTHLHYEVWVDGRAADPMAFLRERSPEALMARNEAAREDAEMRTTHLGLAMGGDGLEIAPIPDALIPRYNSKQLFRSNILVLFTFIAIALGMIAHLIQDGWVRRGWENSGRTL